MMNDNLINKLTSIKNKLNNISQLLNESGDEIVYEMKNFAPVDTGALKASIKREVIDNKLIISGIYYGAFQNYGVSGTNDNKGRKVELGVKPRPSSGDVFKFKKRQFGLKPQQFFSVNDIGDKILNDIKKMIIDDNNNTESRSS